MIIAVNQAISSFPYYTQKRGNKMPSRLTFCFIFHLTFLFVGFFALCFFTFSYFKIILAHIISLSPSLSHFFKELLLFFFN